MRRARKSVPLRPSGRLLESRSDPGPRGMIAALRARKIGRAATESGLQAHPLIFRRFRLRPALVGVQARVLELVRPNEKYSIETFMNGCPVCQDGIRGKFV